MEIGYLEGGSVDSVIHILDSLLNLEFLGVQLVFELINGGFKFADLNTDAKLDAHKGWSNKLPSFQRSQRGTQHP